MHDSAVFPNPVAPPTRVAASRLAWAVLLGAFAIFCLLCVITGIGIHYFLFDSTVPMQVSLAVGRGTAAFLVRSDLDENVAPQSGHFVAVNEQISVDIQSQSVIYFRDNALDNPLIAAVTLKPGASLVMNAAQRPRFDWSRVGYRVVLQQVRGEVDVYLPPGLTREPFVVLETAGRGGVVVYLNQSGSYTVNAGANQVRVYNNGGQAFIDSPTMAPRLIPPGEHGSIQFEPEPAQLVVAPSAASLLQPSQFEQLDAEAFVESDLSLADLVWPWQCGDSQSPPPGRFEVGFPAGRPAIRLVRADGATTHGETGCSQSPWPSAGGLDVTGYSSLVVRTAFYLEYQSLPLCGNLGSECPLMLQIDYKYKDAEGQDQLYQWFHGFYIDGDPSGNAPTRCLSCLTDHDQIYGGTWYTYESPNLLALIPPEHRNGQALLRVRFYASGHEYDVYVGDVDVLAG